jgi:Cys-tRNA(Pro)/Cys-tRNA(Cys) deacylase
MAQTPAVTTAEREGIRFTLHEYEHDPKAASYGLEAAEKLDVDPARLFKTLVVSVDGTLAVAMVPVEAQLDLKRKKLPTHLDASALDHETILVNAGRRGLQMELDPHDLVRLTDARVHEIASGG